MTSRIMSGVFAALAALLVLSSEPARAQGYAPYFDGTILTDSADSSSRYLIVGGAKFRLSASERPYFFTLVRYIVPRSTLDAITNIPREGTVLRERATAPVYVIIGNRKWYVPSVEELQHFGGESAIRTVPQGTLNNWWFDVMRDGLLVRERPDAEVYVIAGNARFWVRTEADLAYYGGWANVKTVPDGSMDNVSLWPACGTFLRERSSGLIYAISDAGGKYLIQNPGSHEWANHLVVPDGALSRFADVADFVCIN